MSDAISSQFNLVDVIQNLSLAKSMSRVTEIVRTAARELADADGATFVVRDRDQCHYLDEDAIAPLWKGLRFPMSACVSGWCMHHRTSVSIPDIFTDYRVPIAACRPTFVKSLFMTPIRQIDPIGAIGVYWARPNAPSEQDTRALEALANATSVAVQNIELHQALERKVLELERSAEVKDQFLLTLSHELRTPMNSILGWSQILREEKSDLSFEMREGIESIYRNAQTEIRLISDLLDGTQCLVGRLKLVRESVDLNEVLRTAARSARVHLPERQITLEVEGTARPAPIDGDPDRLFQIVSNLLSNSAKFTPKRGTIRLSLADEGRHYLIAVTDDGEGISADLLPKVFDRFQSQSSQLTRAHGGLGLGLAIVKSLVEAHGGEVSAHSAGPGSGARFEVRLPHPVAVTTGPVLAAAR